MPQNNIELILFRQFAYYLAFPIFIMDVDGDIIFYNEPVEKLFGLKLSETGEISASEWETIFVPQDKNGVPIKKEDLPLFISHNEQRLAYNQFYIKNILNEIKHIELFTLPVINQSNIYIGLVVFFQEIKV